MSYQTLKDKITRVCDEAIQRGQEIDAARGAIIDSGIGVTGNWKTDIANVEVSGMNKMANYIKNWSSFFQDDANAELLKVISPSFTTNGTNFTSMLRNITLTTVIPALDTRKGTSFTSFANSSVSIETIRKVCVTNATSLSSMFTYCIGLKNITFEGSINLSLSFSHSPLSVKSMKNIISCLKDYSGTSESGVNKLTFSEECWATLEADSTHSTGSTWREYVNSLGWTT